MSDASVSAVNAKQEWSSVFMFGIEYEIQVSKEMTGWLREAKAGERGDIIIEAIAGRSPHVNIVDANPDISSDDDLDELLEGDA